MGFIKVSVCVLVLALVYGCLQRLFTKPLPVVVDGYVHPAFQPVLEKFRENVASGREPGAAFAVYRNGQPLVDVWGGYADVEAARPWRQDTMTQGWSTTKGIAAIVVAVMVDRGWLDYKRPVHEYWPEFKQNGKKNITVEMLLTHQAGLPVLDTPISVLDIREEPERVEKILATQAPVWAPGTQFGYHAITFGPYIDTLVRKADPKRRRMEQIFREEIGEPLGADNWAMNRGFLYYNNSDGNLVFGHPGHGGQIGGADPKASLGFGYVTNHLSIYGVGDDPRYVGLEQIVYKCLKDYDKSEH
ncbi:LACT2-like protein [Mya arenaria]|uniref:LACT2-like protein n=1 Tax=Mya arenaria TaxID=6604 RepID=A0ABY7DHV1_MYAAR|nr:LACT2-like protein [Mya arenaria]